MADDTTGTGGTATGTERTFTQAELERAIGERLARERAKYSDYDELKKKADAAEAEAGKNKTQLDQLLDKFAKMEERAAKAERETMLADIAEAKGLTRRQARRLQGTTREQLEQDADELLEDLGKKPGDGKGATEGDDGKGGAAGATGGDGKGGTGSGTGDAGKPAGDGGKGAGRSLLGTDRPREKVASGAVPGTGDEVDHAKLADSILKGL